LTGLLKRFAIVCGSSGHPADGDPALSEPSSPAASTRGRSEPEQSMNDQLTERFRKSRRVALGALAAVGLILGFLMACCASAPADGNGAAPAIGDPLDSQT
jgi:hypothetical protein